MFAVEVFIEGGRRVIALVGELDLAGVQLADEALSQDFDVLDLSRLEFIDSSGLGVLMRVYQARAGQFVVRGCSAAVARMLELTGIVDLLRFEETSGNGVGSPAH